MGLVDKGLEVLSYMDWLTPILHVAGSRRQDRFSGPSQDYPHIEETLKKCGIRPRHMFFFGGKAHFTVSEGTGQRTAAIMEAIGHLVPQDEIVRRHGPQRKVGLQQRGILDQVRDALKDL